MDVGGDVGSVAEDDPSGVVTVADGLEDVVLLPAEVVGSVCPQPVKSRAANRQKSKNRFMAYHPFRICHTL